MSRITGTIPYVQEPRRAQYRSVKIQPRDYHPAPKKASFLRMATQVTDFALCLGTGALLLGALLLILVSL